MTGPTDLDPCSSPSISTAAARLDSRYRLPRPVCYISLPTPTPHAPPRGPGSNHCPPPCRRAYLCLQPSREVMRSHGEGAGFYVCVPSVPSPRPKQHHGVMELMWTFPRRSHQLPTSQKRNVPSAGLELPGPTCRAGVSVVKSGGDPPSCPGPSFPSITVSPSSLLCVPVSAADRGGRLHIHRPICFSTPCWELARGLKQNPRKQDRSAQLEVEKPGRAW